MKNSPTLYRILTAISAVHLLNDSMQAVIPATFPILERSLQLTFTQVGWIAFALNMTSSILQPVVGTFTDKRPSPYFIPMGMAFSLLGMIGLAFSPTYTFILLSVLFIGLGSAAFHPEGSRVAHMAAGSRKGFAQSIYQVGGNTGSSLAPLMTALIFVPLGQFGAIWFTGFAALAIVIGLFISSWYQNQLQSKSGEDKTGTVKTGKSKIRKHVFYSVVLLIFIVFARSWYSACISNFYQFYLIHIYGLSIRSTQAYIFVFMIAGVIGTFIGGPLSDRFGKRNLILFSMLGATPLAILLPHISLVWVYPVFFLLGMILSSSFSVTVVYAQELIPGKIGMVSGLIVGLAFGMGALGSVALGKMADLEGLTFTMYFCSFLPLLGILAFLLPSDKRLQELRQG